MSDAERPRGFEPQTPAQAAPGSLLGGRYKLEERLGGGSFGAVFRACDVPCGRPVAVKVLGTSALTDPVALARFRAEGAFACRVPHPNVVAVSDFGITESGVAYLVMELLEGHSLSTEIQRHAPLGGPRTAEILAPVCAAVAAAHAAGVIHRDLKPSNILLHRVGGSEQPKILDFGIARIVEQVPGLDRGGVDDPLLGTPAYMAPERFRRQPCGPPCDVYSLGVVMYEMLAGRLPWRTTSDHPLALVAIQADEARPPRFAPGLAIAPVVEALVQRALAREPEARPAAAELGAALAALHSAAAHD